MSPSVANRIYPEGVLALMEQGVDALASCSLALVGSAWEYDQTHALDAEATTGEIVAAGYAREAATLSAALDLDTPYPTIRLALTGASFGGFDGAVKALIVLLSDGTPLLALQEPNGVTTMPLTLATSDPLVVGFAPGGIVNFSLSSS